MPDHKAIYNEEAVNYERLVSREDFQGNILKAIQAVLPLQGIDVVETGAGTGRVTRLLAPFVRSISACDTSAHMLEIAADSLTKGGWHNWSTSVAEHRHLPTGDGCADLCISGWSVCYLVDWNRQGWKTDVAQALERPRVDELDLAGTDFDGAVDGVVDGDHGFVSFGTPMTGRPEARAARTS